MAKVCATCSAPNTDTASSCSACGRALVNAPLSAERCVTPAFHDHPDCAQIREQGGKVRERMERGG